LLLAGSGVIPGLFTGEDRVVERAEALWPLFALMQPAGAAVFALDGILIGAGDLRYLAWSMILSFAVFVPAVLLALAQDWGIVGVWAALLLLMAARLGTTYARFAGRRWAVVGAG
jgi:Na+-driven multidrug efflux pump